MYYIDLELSRLLNTEFITRDVNGVAEEGIWIPIKRNGLVYGKHRTIHLKCLMKERQPNPYGISHYISLYLKDNEVRKNFIESGFVCSMRFLGHAKPSNQYKQNIRTKITPLDEAMEKDREEICKI